MITLIILIVALLLGICLLKCKRINKDITNFILTFLISVSGLFLALFLDRFEQERKEKMDVIKLAEIASKDLENYKTKIQNNNINIDSNAFITINNQILPKTFINILDNDLVLRHFSYLSLDKLKTKSNIFATHFNPHNIKDMSSNKITIAICLSEISYSISVLNYEINYLSGELNKKQLQDNINRLER